MKKLISTLFLLMYFATANGQERNITGTVTDANDRLPLPGVSVRERGTQNGTVTATDGRYSIRTTTASPVLEFSYLGYTTQPVTVGTSNTVNVQLVSDSRILSEVVVTANAIRREKRTLGYSAPTINSEELNQGENPNLLNSLAGKVAGANITTTSNTPGSSSRVVLRGGSSISGNNQALIVVDGVPIDNSNVMGGGSLSAVDFGNRGNDINPDDIELLPY